MTAEQAVSAFLNVVQNMTYDPKLDIPAETDNDFGRARLGASFFDPGLMPVPLIVELEQLGGVTDTIGVATTASQQAFILLHEFRHLATRQTHSNKEYGEWLKGLYDNCFKPQ
jgi:hypothetical protein